MAEVDLTSSHQPILSTNNDNENLSILDLFSQSSNKPLKIVAPMVRYSKLAFRLLCYNLNIDICYTPMIMAESFNMSQKCRDAEFTTSLNEKKLVVQFGANDPIHFGYAAQAVKEYINIILSFNIYSKADAVDLNCGCPQKWALKEGIGSAMLKKPQVVFLFLNFLVYSRLKNAYKKQKSCQAYRYLSKLESIKISHTL